MLSAKHLVSNMGQMMHALQHLFTEFLYSVFEDGVWIFLRYLFYGFSTVLCVGLLGLVVVIYGFKFSSYQFLSQGRVISICDYRVFGEDFTKSFIFRCICLSLCVSSLNCVTKTNFMVGLLFGFWDRVCFLCLNLTELMCGTIWLGL